MKVLLINPAWIKRKQNAWNNIASVMPPLGLAWLAAVLEQQGHEAVILDAHAERVGFDQLPQRLGELGTFDLVGITATTPLINNALEIARMVKIILPQTRVVLGGVHPTVLPAEVLAEKAVDVVVRGEGENTIVDLAAEKTLDEIEGISFRIGHDVRHNPDRDLIADLDSLPMPAYHLLPMDKYYPAAGAAKRLPASSMLATRGCPGRCTFCYRLFGQKLRVRSGTKVAHEIKFLQDRYGIREICFYDDTFTISKKEVRSFCHALSDLNMNLTWSCFSRVDTVDEDMLTMMKHAGCHQIMYGIESANAAILENIGKRADLNKAEHAVQITKKVGIDVRGAFMLGNPGETLETMKETLALAVRLNPEVAIFNITTPFPGTQMHAWADENGYLTTRNWDDYDLSKPVMNLPTVSAGQVQEFYRRVYRRFFLRPRYLAMRVAKLRNITNIIDAARALRTVASV